MTTPFPSKHLSLLLAALPLAAVSLPAAASSHSHHASMKVRATAYHAAAKHSAGISTSTHGRHGARIVAIAVRHESASAMDSGRATAIQAALIRAGYLNGEPSGVWDADSIAAMQKFQDDNGWQKKFTPDSRALAKLGLGSAPLPPTPPTGTPVAAEQALAAPNAQP